MPKFGRATVLAFVGVSGAVVLLPVSGEAQDLTWDTTLSDGLVIGGSGTWDGTAPGWTSDAGGTNEAWTDDSNAIFGGTAGTVTVTGTQSVRNMTFETDGYVITGDALVLTGDIATAGASTITVTTGTTVIDAGLDGTGAAVELITAGAGNLDLGGTVTADSFIVMMGVGGSTTVDGTLSVDDTDAAAIHVQAGTLTTTSTVTGNLTVEASGAFAATGGQTNMTTLTVAGGGIVTNTGDFNVGGNVSNAGSIDSSAGTFDAVNLTGTTGTSALTNSGSSAMTFTGNANGNSGDITNSSSGNLNIQAGITANTGDLLNSGAGDFLTTGLSVNSGTVTNSGSGDITVAGFMDANSGTITNSGAGNITTSGTSGNSGTIINTATATGGLSFGDFFTNSGTLTNAATTDGADVSLGPVDANSGTIENTGAADILASSASNMSGTLSNSGSGNFTLTGNVTLTNGGLVEQTGTGTFTAANINNTAAATVNVSDGTLSTGTFTNNDINAIVNVTGTGLLDVTAGNFTNTNGTVTIDGSGEIQVAAGTFQNQAGGDLVMTGGTLDTITLSTTGDVDVGSATIDADVAASAGTFDVTGGTVTVTGNFNAIGTVDFDVVAGATLDVADTGTFTFGSSTLGTAGTGSTIEAGSMIFTTDFTTDGTLTETAADDTIAANGGTLTITGNGVVTSSVNIASGATVDNSGVIQQDVTVNTGNFVANGGSVAGLITVTGTGAYTVQADTSGDVVNGTAGGGAPTGGTVTITSGTTLTGTVTNNSGTTSVDGTLDGTLALSGGSVLTGTNSAVTGAVTVSGGTATLAGGSFGDGILSSGGTTNVTGEISLTSGALVSNDGYVNIGLSGTVNGDVATTNTGGPATAQIDTFGTINGTVTSGAGLFTNYGTIDGAAVVTGGELGSSGALLQGFTVNGGLLTLFGAGSITGAGTVNAGGAFLVNGGSFADGVDNAGGIIEVAGNASGEIRNTDGSARIDPGVTFTGDVINGADGTFDLSIIGVGTATIDGSLANDGGTANLNGTVTGGTTNTGATAQMLVDSGDVANFGDAPGAGLVNSAGATLTVRGRTTGTITNEDTATVLLQGATLAAGSDLRNAGQVTVTGATTASGAVSNTGTFVVGDAAAGADSLAVTGTFDNLSGGELLVAADGTVGATTFTNADGGTVDLSGTLSGAVENSGLLVYRDNAGIADADRFGGLVTNTATGSILAASGSLFFGAGLASSGTIDLSGTSRTVGDTLTVANGFAGGGAILMDVDFTADLADRITVNGDATGSTSIVVSDVSSGEASGNDIVIASVSGAASADAFVLATPLSIGALTYDISQVGSDFVLGLFGGFVPDVVGLEALPGTLLRQESLPTLRERSSLRLPGDGTAESGGFWYRLSGSRETFSPGSSGTGYVGEMDAVRFRAGHDFDLGETETGRMVLGVNLGFSSAQTALSSPDGTASIDSDARSLGVSATWYGTSGLYVDGQLQYTAIDAAVVSGAARGETSGTGASGALEVGQRLTVPGSDWALTPQARLAYATVDYDDFISGGGLETSLQAAESLRTSIGLSAERAAFEVGGGEGLSIHGAAFLHRELAGDMTSLIAGSEVESSLQEWSGEVSVGVSRRFAGGLGVIYGEAQYSAGFDNPGDNNALSIAIGGNLSF